MATFRAVREIVPGDIIDLEGDKYADPKGLNVSFVCEYALVSAVIHETTDCTVLCVEGVDHSGMPPAHLVRFIKHDPEFPEEQKCPE